MLRIVPPQTTSAATSSRPKSAGSRREAEPVRRSILVIAAEPLVAAALRVRISPEHQVRIATDALVAMEWLQGGQEFDLIFCDLCMPVCSGVELYWALASFSPELASRVVFLSGSSMSDAVSELIGSLGVPMLRKPFSRSELEWVMRGLERRATAPTAEPQDVPPVSG